MENFSSFRLIKKWKYKWEIIITIVGKSAQNVRRILLNLAYWSWGDAITAEDVGKFHKVYF